jgi:hypothetical protein
MKATITPGLALLLGLSLACRVGADEPRKSEPAESSTSDKRAADRKTPDVAKPLLGSWRNEEDNESVVRFEATKCTFARIGKSGLQIARATYEPAKIVTHSWGRKVEYRFELKDQVLFLTLPDGKTNTYLKLDKIPAEVEVKPLALGAAKELPKAKIQSVQEDLARRAKLDQEVRTDLAKRNDAAKVDAENTASLAKLVQEVGWIDAERFGAPTSHNAFLIVQHSMDVPLMLAALPAIERDVKAKRLDAQPYALLHDRLQLMVGEKQRYGTQIGRNDEGALVIMPLEDRKRVEELRKEIGLFALADYLKLFEKENGGKPVTLQDDE